jgi:hypothetical protein
MDSSFLGMTLATVISEGPAETPSLTIITLKQVGWVVNGV